MKIEQAQAPSPTQTFGAKSEAQVSARERAIQALMRPNTPEQASAQAKSTAQEHPVRNPTQVSPEELSAAKASSAELERVNSVNNEEPEAPKEAPKAASEEPLSSQYAILARRERSIRQREQQLRAREAELAKAKTAETPASTAPSFDPSKYVSKEDLLRDPFGILNENGLGYDKLTEIAVQGPSYEQRAMTSEIKALKAELQSLKGETESTKKSFQEQQDLQRKQAIGSIRSEVAAAVRQDPQLETIRATGSVQDVVDLIVRTFDEDGIMLSVDDAAREVEEYLVNEAIKLTKLNKIQRRLAPKPASAAPKLESTEQPKQQPLKTLTNSVSSSAKLSARERAIAAFKGELK